MVVDERARHELFGRLEDVLGAEHAVTLMEHLPPVGWADVATKHDLDVLRDRLRSDMNAMKHESIALFRADLSNALTSQTKTILFTVLGALTSMGRSCSPQRVSSDSGGHAAKLGSGRDRHAQAAGGADRRRCL
jgi:hypothetical protein